MRQLSSIRAEPCLMPLVVVADLAVIDATLRGRWHQRGTRRRRPGVRPIIDLQGSCAS